MNGKSALRATRLLKHRCRTNRPFIRMKGLPVKSESALSSGYCLHDEQMVHQARPFKTVYISFPSSPLAARANFPPQLFQ